MNTFLVVPTIRSLHFFKEWKDQFKDCHIVIVEDNPTVKIETPAVPSLSFTHYTWKDIAADFGSNEWIFSRKNAGIRSYGFWKAYNKGADIIITLDDDCYPTDNDYIARHISNLSIKTPEKWFPTFIHPDFLYTRGFPYSVRNKHPAVISHGLWSNKIDLDGKTEALHPNLNIPAYPLMQTIVPRGEYFPMCSMNLAFRREITPLMFFPLMGSGPDERAWGYDRFDDIWAGIFAKKICDHLGLSVVNGSPFVEHRKSSDVQKNIQKEKRGIRINETLWENADCMVLTKITPEDCYRELAAKICFPGGLYFKKLKSAMKIWSALFP
jgi:hypothetical protein